MGIDEVVKAAVDGADDLLGHRIIAAVTHEQALDLLLHPLAHLVAAGPVQLIHVLPSLLVLPGDGVEQTLQIAGDQNIHGR